MPVSEGFAATLQWLCACALSDLLCQQSDVSGDGGIEWRLRESRCSLTFGRKRVYGGGKGHSIGREVGRLERKGANITAQPYEGADFTVDCDDGARNQKGDDAVCDTTPGAGDGYCDACSIMGGVTTENEMGQGTINYFVVEVD